VKADRSSAAPSASRRRVFGRRRFAVFTAVTACLVASIGIRCAVNIQIDRALYQTYPMVDRVEQATRVRVKQAKEIGDAEKLLGLLALIAVPVGILLARREAQGFSE
jgi:hypothetical protein